jgi:hypothetical protein
VTVKNADAHPALAEAGRRPVHDNLLRGRKSWSGNSWQDATFSLDEPIEEQDTPDGARSEPRPQGQRLSSLRRAPHALVWRTPAAAQPVERRVVRNAGPQGDQTMTLVEVPPLSSADAVLIFEQLLRSLSDGPQCACSLANEAQLREREVYPFLAELLAREWISPFTESDLAAVLNITERQLGEPERDLAAMISSMVTRLQGIPMSSTEGIVARSREWYEFFRELGRLPSHVQAVLYFQISPLGRDALTGALS